MYSPGALGSSARLQSTPETCLSQASYLTLLKSNYLVALQQVNTYIGKHYSKVLMIDSDQARAALLETMYEQLTTLIACIMALPASAEAQREQPLATGAAGNLHTDVEGDPQQTRLDIF